jgi:hypothetical protein
MRFFDFERNCILDILNNPSGRNHKEQHFQLVWLAVSTEYLWGQALNECAVFVKCGLVRPEFVLTLGKTKNGLHIVLRQIGTTPNGLRE